MDNTNTQVEPYKLSLPLKIAYFTSKEGKQKFMRLNLNEYRNAQYFKLNNAKIAFKNELSIKAQIESLPRFNKIQLKYTIYFDSNREFDISNIGSIVDKFFSDALVEYGKLEDDNFKYLNQVTYCIGSVDKVNPRVEVEILEVEEIG